MEITDKYVAIDLGNTSAKVSVFEQKKLTKKQSGITYADLATYVNALSPNHVIISSVNQQAEILAEDLDAPTLIVDHLTAIPITNKYATSETLGRDRLAAVVGACVVNNDMNTLVIDVGTCITYDFINDKNEYLGGGISPGVDLKLKALHNFTAHLPLIEKQEVESLIGNSTEKAILSGVINGTIAEIEGIIRMYKHKFPHLRTIICGGGASALRHKLKTETKLVPDLVMIGLNRILEYNV